LIQPTHGTSRNVHRTSSLLYISNTLALLSVTHDILGRPFLRLPHTDRVVHPFSDAETITRR